LHFCNMQSCNMSKENEQRAIMGGGCITLIIAVLLAVVCVLVAILDKV